MSDSYVIARARVRRKRPPRPKVRPAIPVWAAATLLVEHLYLYGISAAYGWPKGGAVFGLAVFLVAADLWNRWRWRQYRAATGQGPRKWTLDDFIWDDDDRALLREVQTRAVGLIAQGYALYILFRMTESLLEYGWRGLLPQ